MKKLCLLLIGLSLFLISCIKPIDETIINEMIDSTPPVISLISPVKDTLYTQNVSVTGTALDQNGKVEKVAYEVKGTLGTLLAGSISGRSLGSGGEFSFTFSTVSYNGPIILYIEVEDWNDNISQMEISLQDPGSPVSSLSALPSNKSIELSWDSVEGAVDYTILYTINGTLPSLVYGESITTTATSVILDDLKNGNMHIFLLKANLPGGVEYWSSYVSAIPLSPFTLAPQVTSGYGEIYLEWNEIEGTNEFRILRDIDPSGSFDDYTGIIRGTSYTDRAVYDNSWYYYKVVPSLSGSIESQANAAQTFQNPPTSENSINTLNSPGTAEKIVYPPWGGEYAFLAAGSSGLITIDVSIPGDIEVSAIVDTENALDLALYDYGSGVHFAYVADGAGKIKAINISDPLNPILAGSYVGVMGHASAIAVEPGKQRIYVIDNSGETAFLALSINSTGNINLIDDIQGGASYDFLDIEISNFSNSYTFVYLTTSDKDMVLEYYLYTNTVPNPDEVTLNYYRQYTETDHSARYIKVHNGYLHVLAQTIPYLEPPPPYMYLVMSKYPSPLTKVGSTAFTKGNMTDLALAGDTAYVTDGIGLQLIDISSPTSPSPIDFWNTPGSSKGVAVKNNMAFVASGSLGMQAVDTALPNSLMVSSVYSGSGSFSGLAIRDNYVYATGSTSGFKVIDISNPASPSSLSGGSLSMTGANYIALSGSYAFVSKGINGMSIVDISEPGSPVITGTVPSLSGSVGRISIKGDYSYLMGTTGVQIFDISDPTTPIGVGFYDTAGGGMNDIAIKGSLAYVAEGAYFQPSYLNILDLANPAQPVLKERTSFGMIPEFVSLWEDYALVGDAMPFTGTYSVNINPSSANYLTSAGPCDPLNDDSSAVKDGVVFGDYLYLADGDGGLMIIDVSNPATLNDSDFLRSIDWTSSQPSEIVLNGDHAVLADTSQGLVLIDLFP